MRHCVGRANLALIEGAPDTDGGPVETGCEGAVLADVRRRAAFSVWSILRLGWPVRATGWGNDFSSQHNRFLVHRRKHLYVPDGLAAA